MYKIGEIVKCTITGFKDYGIFAKHLKLSIKNTNYKVDGKSMKERDLDGFLPLKKHLNIWINEKIKEINH